MYTHPDSLKKTRRYSLLGPRIMAYRLPTHLESFIPPPTDQVGLQARPWSGTFAFNFHGTGQGQYTEVFVTAAETDGERQDLWPRKFYLYLGQRQISAPDVSAWAKRSRLPVCTFMPDRHPDPQINATNQASFAWLSRHLLSNSLVAFAPWNMPGGQTNTPGAGIMLYATPSTSSLLVGVIFLSHDFPEFVTGRHDVIPRQSYQAPGAPSSYGSAPSSAYSQYPPYPSS
ncbi:hypothetical protein BV25DRAFT_1897250 [Artomyces pyxidatus]|uniref:Uncharacterized protein n=1 Tax=Artomyces pyxidatus TaxID=48021 RepID=A0ACB8TEY6_9AGAM|nr:hypothetical protein BV25DRAFT_1897250 [Artomyces pyxidatus]